MEGMPSLLVYPDVLLISHLITQLIKLPLSYIFNNCLLAEYFSPTFPFISSLQEQSSFLNPSTFLLSCFLHCSATFLDNVPHNTSFPSNHIYSSSTSVWLLLPSFYHWNYLGIDDHVTKSKKQFSINLLITESHRQQTYHLQLSRPHSSLSSTSWL